MKLENQVVSLELAKELKNAGYNQEGLWWWRLQNTLAGAPSVCFIGMEDYAGTAICVAPTVAELGEVLPDRTGSLKDVISPLTQHRRWVCQYLEDIKARFHGQVADTEANARAKMWLYLKKEKLT